MVSFINNYSCCSKVLERRGQLYIWSVWPTCDLRILGVWSAGAKYNLVLWK